ncbi:GRAM domain protein [Cladophialophora carrionii]|uniref:GRAM domain protein n=1 Tax=Cladophialophora carrionii TaxID=86049 RepID=A0A1C1D217_9EURO|nr:GRAM domain protein [Cladophialophora carrionii]
MPEPSPQLKGLKKVLTSRRRSSEPAIDETIRDLRTESLDSITIEKSPTRQSARSISQDGSNKSGSSGVRKLLPGHSKRQRRRQREAELKAAVEDLARGRTGTGLSAMTSPQPALSRRASSHGGEADAGLLTDDSEIETPPLVTRDSHTGFASMSSPLISTTTTRSDGDSLQSPVKGLSIDKIPTLIEPAAEVSGSPSPKSTPVPESGPASPFAAGLVDRADTLQPESRRNSVSTRGKSPVRRFRDVFGKQGKSPKVSPERRETMPAMGATGNESSMVRSNTEVQANNEPKPIDAPPPVPPVPAIPQTSSMPNLETSLRPLTPPARVIDTPVTTVTPPTPTDTRFEGTTGSPKPEKPASRTGPDGSNIVVSSSGNMISHRRIRSTSSTTHQPSKLSTSVTAPLTPTDDKRTPSGGIFSSWVSAAQNAATTITNLTGQNRNRSGTNASDPAVKPKTVEEPIKEEEEVSEPETLRRQLAVETLGSGDLNFEHLGLTIDDAGASAPKSELSELRKDSTLEKDVAAAKVEDTLAKRAVSAAYERMSATSTPVAEIPDPLGSSMRHAQNIAAANTGERTPPNGSVFESEVGSIKRTGSVRSKMKRRSRGSSTATGQSAIGAMIGASTATLANPATGPRLTGFTMAPKQRNRNFHQQFRSVPEDDYLIEDYSCALQKEILLAGRIYISEGHICFFSNILGWVTTVVISFEEVVSIERESTAVVFPNAIAIQTLHARHTFRSLLYREQTYELLIGIWRVSHPASFQKSINGKQLAAEEASVAPVVEDGASGQPSEGSTTEESGSEDDDSAPSLLDSSASAAGSDVADAKVVSRKPSGMNASAVAQTASILAGTAGDVPQPLAAQAGLPEAAKDFPGPAAHVPTECSDGGTHYDKIIKDEVIPAPLGKIYSLLYGPESGFFVRKFLADECKCTEVVFEDDKKGLNNDIKSRQYSYIKPLGGSIGPKQTKCITTENLDAFDLEKSVSVTCSTQTPDVPSGSAFSTKTRYCLSWAPGNQTRLQMNCTVEWTAKSWLKGPIEKGAADGQQQYGDQLMKVLKSAVSGRPRGTTNASKGSKLIKKKRKGEKKAKEEIQEEEKAQAPNWGVFEPLRGPLTPVTDMLRPVLKMEAVVAILCVMVVLLWIRGPSTSTQLGPHSSHSSRMAAYDSMWVREENEFWDWLESRASVDTVVLRQQSGANQRRNRNEASVLAKQTLKQQRQGRPKSASSLDVEDQIKAEKISQRELEDAIRITKERLEVLENVVDKKKRKKR